MTSISTAAAEIYALSECLRDARLTQWRLQEMGLLIPSPLVIQVDASCALSFQQRTCTDSRLRGTFDLRAQWIKELQDQRVLRTKHVGTADNVADLFTKCLDASAFSALVSKLLCNNLK